MTRDCVICGKQFEPTHGRRQKTCSKICSVKLQKISKIRWNKAHREYHKAYQKIYQKEVMKEYRWQRRLMILQHYGGSPPRCACCGEQEPKFLEIDHINNDGYAHRKQIGKGRLMHEWLIKNNYPEGFQILCANCNHAKGNYGECPHQTMKKRKEVKK